MPYLSSFAKCNGVVTNDIAFIFSYFLLFSEGNNYFPGVRPVFTTLLIIGSDTTNIEKYLKSSDDASSLQISPNIRMPSSLQFEAGFSDLNILRSLWV